MSSYTIDKKEYMKAAGLVAGIAKDLDLWLYDYETRRNSTPEDYKRRFTECYTMNSISVMEQYHGEEVGAPSNDMDDYAAEFKRYYDLGKDLILSGGRYFTHAMQELISFFSSALYQTEKEAYAFKMQMFFDRIITCIFKEYYRQHSGYKTQSWGTLEIEEPKEKYMRVI